MKNPLRQMKRFRKLENDSIMFVRPLRPRIYTGYITEELHQNLYKLNKLRKRI